MNSSSDVNQSSLVNFSADLPSLDAKDTLLGFPFDHLYACHSDSPDQRDTLQVNKEVDLATQCLIGEDKNLGATGSTEVHQLNDRLTASENQNKRLKDLLIYHLDLIQQQNDLITKRDKLYQALRLENESLKTKLNRRHGLILPPPPPPPPPFILPPPPPPLLLPPPPPPPPPVTSTFVKPAISQPSKVMLDSFSELMLPENRASSSYMFDTDLSQPKKYEKETFGIARTTIVPEPEVKTYGADAGPASAVEKKSKYSRAKCSGFKPIDSKRSLIKKDVPKNEKRSEPLYTITSTSGNPVIQRVQRNRKRNCTGVGHLSRMTKTTPKVEPAPEPSKPLDDTGYDHFGINKKNKFINTYGKSKTAITSTVTSSTTTISKRSTFGSLSERLQLIDTTPTGEDPYQLGEADLREQSPIPKLMLQKTNHGRMKVLDQPTRRIYDPDSPEPQTPRARSNRFLSSTFTADLKKEAKSMMMQESDGNLIKTDTFMDWRIYSSKYKTGIEASTSSTHPLPTGSTYNLEEIAVGSGFNATEQPAEEGPSVQSELTQLFDPDNNFLSPLLNSVSDQPQQSTQQPSEQDGQDGRDGQESHDPSMEFTPIEPLLPTAPGESKRGRKRAHSTTGLGKVGVKVNKPPPKPRGGRGRGSTRGRRTPPPGRTTSSEYFTHAGDQDLCWYHGLDSDIKLEDLVFDTLDLQTSVEAVMEGLEIALQVPLSEVDQRMGTIGGRTTNDAQPTTDVPAAAGVTATTGQHHVNNTHAIEVPRWREMSYTSLNTSEGTESVEDKVYEKRHQKLEAEERRQLRWHMRRIREQRHVEKLRQRHRDSWCTTVTVPSVYTVWPRPQRDMRFIEITDTLPVTAFGEALPELPEADFMLPWVRTSKALKRSKRSKTLH